MDMGPISVADEKKREREREKKEKSYFDHFIFPENKKEMISLM